MIRVTIETAAYWNSWEDFGHPAETVVREYDDNDVDTAAMWFRENIPPNGTHLRRAVWETA